MSTTRRGYDGRSLDLTFSWVTKKHGEEWECWRILMEEWIATQHQGTDAKRHALVLFIERYLIAHAPYATDIAQFFSGYNGHCCSSNEFVEILSTTISSPNELSRLPNQVTDFLDWVIAAHFSEPDDSGKEIPMFTNPFSKIKAQTRRTETVRNPLPYRYIKELRHILCPDPATGNFNNWVWAQNQTGNSSQRRGDWFEVAASQIDKADPDCVWRNIQVIRNVNGVDQVVTIHQMWSPVAAMVLFIKLYLPLRTYQVRMLDSGEADTWRYESGDWLLNAKHKFAMGSEKRPFKKGVFDRNIDTTLGVISTGLYINTNKTADQNKAEQERGYTIPWQHETVLRWMEKLRNWQEKYNPITGPCDCTSLLKKHTAHIKSKRALQSMGEICFLFRDASASGDDKTKPYQDPTLLRLWHKLLYQLENNVAAQGVTLSNGQRLRFVEEYPEGKPLYYQTKTLFPMHSLRVSLITCYALEGTVPIPVISKLLAGHSRLLMTLYYTKITPSVMAERMRQSENLIEQNETESLRSFLSDAKLRQIKCKTAYNDEASIESALVNCNPVGWEHRDKGICLVGGNTVKSNELSTLGGCWNGGELLRDAKTPRARVYDAVPNGPENCVRCRWFITDASYLQALNAHHNYVSYRATEAANFAAEIEAKLDKLQDEKYFAQEDCVPFTKQTELQELERRYEKQLVEADNYAKDLIATFSLIFRIMNIENGRVDGDTVDKLVAVGKSDDINIAIKYMETDSELLQLSLLCDDAEFYPDLGDEVRKSSAIYKRSQVLNRILMKKGFEPYFLQMDDQQQLIAANAMMRQMAKQAQPMDRIEGYRQVANYLDTEGYLLDNGLLQSGVSALTGNSKEAVLKLNQIIASTA